MAPGALGARFCTDSGPVAIAGPDAAAPPLGRCFPALRPVPAVYHAPHDRDEI
jgi:hypothetical protein